MKGRSIFFTGPMVQAILKSGKMRVWKNINPYPKHFVGGTAMSRAECEKHLLRWTKGLPYKPTTKKPTKNGQIWEEDNGECFEPIKCPYGEPGDRLWVRETWRPKGHNFPIGHSYEYRATAEQDFTPTDGLWKPSNIMPREASRITLEVVDVRVDRLREVGNGDAILTKGVEAMNYNAWAWAVDLQII